MGGVQDSKIVHRNEWQFGIQFLCKIEIKTQKIEPFMAIHYLTRAIYICSREESPLESLENIL